MKLRLLFFTLIFPSITTLGQHTSITIGHEVQISSAVLNEARTILIHTPTGYQQGKTEYPVLYILDGEWNFKKSIGLIDHLTGSGKIPDMIVVGIPNVFRNGRPARIQDLAPSQNSKGQKDGAQQFLGFLTDDLIPYIDANYRTQPYRILSGHSLGGLFAVFSLFQNPDAFDAVVAISPSLARNSHQQAGIARTYFTNHSSLAKSLHLFVGNEGGNTLLGTEDFVETLSKGAPPDLDWQFSHLEEEDHVSVFLPALQQALTSIFDGWTIPEHYLSDHDVSVAQRHYKKLSERLGFDIGVPEFIYTTLGYRILATQEFDYAKWTFEQQLLEYPSSSTALVGLGDVMLLQGAFKDAKTYFQEALKSEPAHERAARLVEALNNY